MSGRPTVLPKLDMGAVKDKDAKEKERTKFGASMKKLSASIKRGMTPRSRSVSLDPEVTSATNSVTGGSFPSTPQKPDDIVNDGLDDVKATIAEAQALTADDQPSAPSTPEPADSAEALSHTLAQDAVHNAVEKVEADAPAPPAPLPAPQAAESPAGSAEVELAPPADVPLPTTVAMGANGPVPMPAAPKAEPAPPPVPPPTDTRGPAHAFVEPTEQPDEPVVRVEIAEPAKPEAAEVEPAPRKARQATERRGLRRHVTPRKVLAVASLVGLAYLAKDPVERELERRRLLLAPPPPPPPKKGPFSFVSDLFK